MRVSDLIIEYLRQETPYIFGIVGKAVSPIFDSVINRRDIKIITTRHEEGAAFIATGYAQASGKLGVCIGTTGSGSTNLLTGVAAAYMNSVPLLVITGQTSTEKYGKGAHQESTGEGRTINTVEIFRHATKHSTSIVNPTRTPEILQNAIRLAKSGRMGPVHLNIPFDVLMAEIDHKVNNFQSTTHTSKLASDHNSIRKAINLIEQSKHPTFIMGSGCVFSGGSPVLIGIAQKYNIPLATTHGAKGGVYENNPLNLGILGVCGHDTAFEYISNESDLLIAVGTSFGEFGTMKWKQNIAANKKMIHIDIDPGEIGKNYPVDIGLVGDAKTILQQIEHELQIQSIPPKLFKGNDVSSSKWNLTKVGFQEKLDDISLPLKPTRVIKEVRDNTPANTIFVSDAGQHAQWVQHYLPIYEEGEYYSKQNFSSMGYGVCASIGIKLAKPKKPVICFCGDAGFQMNGNEIATAKQFNIPVIWIILNDSRWGMPYYGMLDIFGRTDHCDLPNADFAIVAKGLGIDGYTVTKPNELPTIIKESLAIKKPVVIDVKIDPNERVPFYKATK